MTERLQVVERQRAAEVRVRVGVGDLVADDRVELADLEVDAVADRGAQGDVSLLDGDFATSATEAAGHHARVRAEHEFGLVAGAPGAFVDGLLELNLDVVQVEAVLTVGTGVREAIRDGVARADVPDRRGVDEAAQRGGAEGGVDGVGFFGLNDAGEAHDAGGRESDAPLIELHLMFLLSCVSR